MLDYSQLLEMLESFSDCMNVKMSNFNREFRRVTGVSPSQWRAEKRATDAKTSAVIPDATGPERFI